MKILFPCLDIPHTKCIQSGKMRLQAGFTLLEMMVSLSLGLLLVAGIGAIFVGSNQTNRVQTDNARIQEAGRYALEFIGRSLRQAGYTAVSVLPNNTHMTFSGVPISGVNTACPSGSPVSDIVTVQYDGTAGEQDCQAGAVTAGEVVQQTFFIENNALRCNAVRANAAPTPPTACPAAGAGSELLPNVEDLQVLFGIDTDGNQSADQYAAAPGNWGQVVSARVCVLVRSENQGISIGRQSYLNCAGALGAATGAAATTQAAVGDSRIRRAFVATFNLRNRVTLLP
jgi:type IV pilus assembly protein PilW